MALRLGPLVLRGELFNTRDYSVHGWLQFLGQERPLMFDLTGNPDADLKGQHIRFEARDAREREDQPVSEIPAEGNLNWDQLAWHQIGPTGAMTATRKARLAEMGASDSGPQDCTGATPVAEWKRCLYLEWFSQNGRVVLELLDPWIEFVGADAENGDHEHGENKVPDGFDWEASGSEDPEEPLLLDGPGAESSTGVAPEGDDPYGLFPSDLQDQLDAQSDEVDRAVLGEQTNSREMQEIELMDELLEHGEREPVSALLDDPLKLPHPDQLSEEEAEQALKCLLARLAQCGVALAVCEHYTPLDAYRLLVEQICKKEMAFPELKNTQWVQGFMTSDYCSRCEEEAEREFQEIEQLDANASESENPDSDADGATPELPGDEEGT